MNFLLDIKSAFLPEIIILFFVLVNVFLAVILNKKYYKISLWVNILGVLMSLCSIGFLQAEPTYNAFNNSIICNVYTVFYKCLILISTFFVILFSYGNIKKHNSKPFEYFSVLMSSVFSGLLLSCSNDFLTAFVALNILIISNTLLISLGNRRNLQVSAFRYLVGALVSSAILEFGTSYLYGITGSLNFDSLAVSLVGYHGGLLFVFAMIFIIIGLILNLLITSQPKLFERIEYPFSLYLSVVPQFALYSILSRILVIIDFNVSFITLLVSFFALGIVVYALFSMLKESNINRYLAYNTMVQNGFILLILSLANIYNIASLLCCLICYLFLTVAIFSVAIIIKQRLKSCEFSSFSGLAYNAPFFATAIIFIFMALAGLPPTCGFWTRFFVLSSVLRLGIDYFVILLCSLFLFIIALLVYVKPIELIFEKNTKKVFDVYSSVISKVTLYFSTMAIILLCFYSGKIVELCEIVAYILH